MRARPLALCGLLSALAAALLILGGVLPGMVFCAPILAMGVLLPVLEEWGPKAAGTSYAAVSILALLLPANRETAFVYLFFGWYPILRPKIAALPSRPLRVLARLAVCSAAAVLLYGLALRLMGLTEEIAAWYVNALLLAAGNAVFLLTDATLARLTGVWHWKLKKHLYR
ncbi:hypothetical protein [uncultured Oscillibacter sp.]|uniref:hypothetical protein n=1 Tax=uncultured Oscillibacter sp. TaxID=876091 RepID=UPI002621B449|nr:hypothetical protein [uncultured Oscillibacter sp.]